LVEMTGVEPVSENTFPIGATSVVYRLISPLARTINKANDWAVSDSWEVRDAPSSRSPLSLSSTLTPRFEQVRTAA